MGKIKISQNKTTSVSTIFFIIIIALSVFRIWLIKDRELVAITPSPHDSLLYITNASSLINNRWFGPYDERIISRGPIFPLLIAGAYLLHIPLGMANTIFYVLIASLFPFIAYKLLNNKWVIIPLYVLLLFNPFVIDHETSFEVVRSTFYPALILGVALSILGLLVTAEKSFKKALLFSVVSGCVFFLFWYYREEGFFILPLIGMSYAHSLWHAWKNKKISRRYLIALIIPIIIFALLTQLLCLINLKYYGIYTTREFSHKSYSSAFAALLRIRPDSDNPLIPITKNQRMILYQVSPSFAKLQPFFEGDGGKNWAGNSIVWTGIPSEEREIAGGAFYFAMREAIWDITKPSQAKEQQFFEQLTKEINLACSQHYVSCGTFPLSGFSLLNQSDRILFLNNFVNTVQTGVLADKIDLSTVAKYSSGPEVQIDLFRKMTHGIILTEGQQQPTPNPLTEKIYRLISWWYRSVTPWIFFCTMIHYLYRIIRKSSLNFYDWYQASLVTSSLFFYFIVAIFGTLKSPTDTTAGSYTSGTYGLLLLFVVLEIMNRTTRQNMRRDIVE